MTLLTPAELARDGCAPLEQVLFVVVAARLPAPATLLDCAAHGARLLLIGRQNAGALAALQPGRAFPWGEGVVLWGETPAAVAPLARHEVLQSALVSRRLFSRALGPWPASRSALPLGPRALRVLLALYVALLAACGWLGRRRAGGAARWGLGLAAVATTALAVAGARLGQGEAGLFVRALSLGAPSGNGTTDTELVVQDPRPARYRVRLPWGDQHLWQVELPPRLGSPFTTVASRFTLLEDLPQHAMALGPILIGPGPRDERTSEEIETGPDWPAGPTIKWRERAQGPTARLERRGQELWVVNASDAPFREGAACTAKAATSLRAFAAGEAHPVTLAPLGGIATPAPLVDALRYQCAKLPRDAYLLVTVATPATAMTVEPDLPKRGLALQVVAGAIPPAGGTP